MSIAIESKDMEEKIYNLFPTPLNYKNVGTDLVNQEMIDDAQKQFHKSMEYSNVAVSYTHLTLPTNREV